MRLEKRKNENGGGGWFIRCFVGSNWWDSWWSGPPKSIYHVDMGYIKDRYPIIRTEKRAQEFKKLYKQLWIEVTPMQRELMEHSLGIQRAKKPYRNRFICKQGEEWEELISKGLANRRVYPFNEKEETYLYFLTKLGVEFILGKSIKQATYKDL